MVTWRTSILLGAASLLVASFGCAGADSTPSALTPVPIERVIPEGMVSPTDPAAESVSPNSVSDGTTSTSASAIAGGASSNTKDKPDPAVAAPIQPASDAGKDLTDAQQRDMDAQIAELRKSPDVLAECARENRDSVPAPGSAGEIEWYAAAAIKYAACASSKTTGVDLGGK